MAYSLHEHRLYFHPGAEEDIENKRIRMVSSEGFDRDPLRMIRGLRYLSILEGFRLDEKTKRVIRRKASLLRSISVERIKMEIDRILLSPNPFLAMRELAALGLLQEIFPELQIPQRMKRMAIVRMEAFSHYLRFIRYLGQWNGREEDLPLNTEGRLIVSYVALFTDMGRILGMGHQWAGEEPISQKSPSHLAYEIMTRMKFSSRFMIIFSLFDQRASTNDGLSRRDQNLVQLCHRIKTLYKGAQIISPPTLVSGSDVMRLGYEPGPVVGYILHCIREKQIRGEIEDRKQALAYLRETFGSEHTPDLTP